MRRSSLLFGSDNRPTEAFAQFMHDVQVPGDNLAAIDNAQSPQAYLKALKEIVEFTDRAKLRVHGAFRQDYGRLGNPQKTPQPSQGGVVDYRTYFGGGQ